jgi:hypothetical protein
MLDHKAVEVFVIGYFSVITIRRFMITIRPWEDVTGFGGFVVCWGLVEPRQGLVELGKAIGYGVHTGLYLHRETNDEDHQVTPNHHRLMELKGVFRRCQLFDVERTIGDLGVGRSSYGQLLILYHNSQILTHHAAACVRKLHLKS